MSLTLDATVGGASSNGYATAVDAIALADYRIGGAAFVALTADQQIQALVTATRDIDSIANAAPGEYGGFIGEKATVGQALEWPRTGTDFDADALPAVLVAATAELAISYTPLFVSGGDPLNLDTTAWNVKRRKVSDLETEFFGPTGSSTEDPLSRFPMVVQNYLRSLVIVTADDVWGSADVTRGS